MTTDITISHSGEEPREKISRKRQIGFYVSGGLFLLLCVGVFGLMSGVLPLVLTGWFQPVKLGMHQLHETLASAFFWSIMVGMIFTMVRPGQMISALRQTLAILTIFLLFLLVSGNLMEPLVLMSILMGLAVVTAVLHPARPNLFRLRGGVHPWLIGLVIVAAVPLLNYSFGHLQIQIGASAADSHAEKGHWAIMSVYALAIVICGLLAGLRADGWRVPAWSAGVLAALLGLGAIFLPGQASTIDLTWGVLAIVWGVVFIAAAERYAVLSRKPSYVKASPLLVPEKPSLFSIVVTADVIIERPSTEVFAFIAAAENDPLWCPTIISISQIAGNGPGQGAKYEMRHTPGGMKFEAIVETLTYHPHSRIEWRMTDKGHVLHGVYVLEAVAGGTRLRQTSHIRFAGWLRIPGLFLKGVIKKDVQKEMNKQFENLKQHLESR